MRVIPYTYIRIYVDVLVLVGLSKRGRNFTVVATVDSTGITRVGGSNYYPCGGILVYQLLPVWGSLLPILSHMGLARKAHLGIRHMVNVVRFVIWWEEGGTPRDRNQKRFAPEQGSALF